MILMIYKNKKLTYNKYDKNNGFLKLYTLKY